MARPTVGLLGGSGLRDRSVLEDDEPRALETPYGSPSDAPRIGRHGSRTVVFLPRHGKGHRTPPHRINHRANLWALRELGVTQVLATSSTGSLRKPIAPGTFVVPHDYVGFWSIPTFHDAEVVHATPGLDETLRTVLTHAAKKEGANVRGRGVYVQTSGPRLETRAEIEFFRGLGDVLGMTMASEATLASELGLPYAALCSVDNYCHGIVDRPLTFEQIRKTQERNAEVVRPILTRALELIP